METTRNQRFDNRRVPIDGIRFEDCTFTRTKLIYRGEAPVEFSGCTFDSCTWVFEGAANETLQFLSTLGLGLGADGQNLVTAIFESVREGTFGERLTTIPAIADAA